MPIYPLLTKTTKKISFTDSPSIDKAKYPEKLLRSPKNLVRLVREFFQLFENGHLGFMTLYSSPNLGPVINRINPGCDRPIRPSCSLPCLTVYIDLQFLKGRVISFKFKLRPGYIIEFFNYMEGMYRLVLSD